MPFFINHGPDLEKAIDAVKEEISKNEFIRHKYSTRYLAIKLLENDPEIEHFTHRFFAMGIISRMFTMVFKIG